jgi:hypothetical protein
MALQILMGLAVHHALGRHQVEHPGTLIMVVFQEQPSSWRQGGWGRFDKSSDGAHAITASIEGKPGLVIADQSLEMVHRIGGDVRGIRHHQMQGAPPRLHSLKPIPLDDAHAVAKS